MNNKTQEEKEPVVIAWWLILVIVLALWGLGWLYLYNKFGGNPSEAGQFGDMFGAVNALFSGLAFGGVIYTILLQRKELWLQRQEFKKAVEAQEDSARSLNAQVESMRKTALLNGYSTLHGYYSTMSMKHDMHKPFAEQRDEYEGNIKHILNSLSE